MNRELVGSPCVDPAFGKLTPFLKSKHVDMCTAAPDML